MGVDPQRPRSSPNCLSRQPSYASIARRKVGPGLEFSTQPLKDLVRARSNAGVFFSIRSPKTRDVGALQDTLLSPTRRNRDNEAWRHECPHSPACSLQHIPSGKAAITAKTPRPLRLSNVVARKLAVRTISRVLTAPSVQHQKRVGCGGHDRNAEACGHSFLPGWKAASAATLAAHAGQWRLIPHTSTKPPTVHATTGIPR